MAPMTRCQAIRNLAPNPIMADYYARRSDAGLIISEATIVCSSAQGYPNTPGIFTTEQVNGWKRITDAVHQNNGKIFSQLWHVGRASHPMYINGKQPIAPSAITLSGTLPRSDLPYGKPRSLRTKEISSYIEYFSNAAYNAMQAGFDGIEIHGGNGYLIDQFLHSHTNQRRDKYGKTPAGRSKFLLEVIDAIAEVVGYELIGIRLSPGAYTLGIKGHPEDASTFKHFLREIEKHPIAYLHIAIDDNSMKFDYLDGSSSEFIRRHYSGNLIGNGNYSPKTAAAAIEENAFDLISFARLFLANPDLIKKIKHSSPLTHYCPSMQKTIY